MSQAAEYVAQGDALMIQANKLYEEAARFKAEADRFHLLAITAWAKAEQPRVELGMILSPPVPEPSPPLDTAAGPC